MMSNFFNKGIIGRKLDKVRKQVVVDPDLYKQLKAKMFLQNKTISQWLEEQIVKEIKEEKT